MRLACVTVFVDTDILTSRMRLRALVPARNAIALRPPHPHLCLAPTMATPASPSRARPPASVQRADRSPILRGARPTRPLPRRSAAPSPQPGRPPLPSSTRNSLHPQSRHHQIRGRWQQNLPARRCDTSSTATRTPTGRRRSSLWACGCWGRARKTRS
ncbi:hypothetical protein B0H14DRAFT_2885093 [Mycena olivaceomarginata]|nr:hypothetical protein B0H14DRAFT_2885093 [Mycena olivaceomarginata]